MKGAAAMFRIGEFSKIAQVSGRLLRYYDELGLLQPVRIDQETGYRYYSAHQLPQLNRILALKELGLTLDQIARLLEGKVSTDEIRGMLLMKKAQIEQTVREELLRFRYIESRIAQIDRDGALRGDDVVLKSVSAQQFIGVEEVSTTLTACRATAWDMRRLLTAQVGAKDIGNFVVVLHSELWDLENLNVEIGFLLNNNRVLELIMPGGEVAGIRELPAVEMMASTMRIGQSELGHSSYAAIGYWAEANGFRFTGPSREVFLQIERGREDEAVAEIQIPVERLTPAPSLTLSAI
jgi:DNA-binding transcriptional MerR regulator/effector-binding domain-containing protein